jgi:hypothetical protein
MARSSNLSRRILVNVKRDMTEVTPKVIWQHDKPILELIHGEGNITEVAADTLDDGYTDKVKPDLLPWNKTMEVPARPSSTLALGHVFIGNPDSEWQRLADVYGKHHEENVLLVEKIYGRPQEGRLASLIGKPTLKDLPEQQLRGLILDYGYAPEPHKDAPLAEKEATWAKRRELHKLPMDKLLPLAEEFGVDVG